MRNIALSIFFLFSLLLASTANQKAKQRRVRREKSTRKFLLYLCIEDAIVQLARKSEPID